MTTLAFHGALRVVVGMLDGRLFFLYGAAVDAFAPGLIATAFRMLRGSPDEGKRIGLTQGNEPEEEENGQAKAQESHGWGLGQGPGGCQ